MFTMGFCIIVEHSSSSSGAEAGWLADAAVSGCCYWLLLSLHMEVNILLLSASASLFYFRLLDSIFIFMSLFWLMLLSLLFVLLRCLC